MLKLPSDPRILRLSPACLPTTALTRQESFLGIRCYATGWGQTEYGGDLQSELHQVSKTFHRPITEYLSHLFQVELRVVPNEICDIKYGARYNISIHDYHLCAGPIIEGGKGTCVVRENIDKKI